jgi:hypothetical protein
MGTTIVNGFVCTSACDAAMAKKGVDPHPKMGAAADPGGKAEVGPAARTEGPAVIFGGNLARPPDAAAPVGASAAADPATLRSQTPGVDLLV